MEFKIRPIGVIHTGITDRDGPIQPLFSENEGTVEVFDGYQDGLKDIEGFSHLIILYIFHKAGDMELVRSPFLEKEEHGIFAMRAPNRPNKIGISVVELLGREGNLLRVRGADMLDGTPLIDIKPYVPDFDNVGDARIGWLEGKLRTGT